MNMTFNVIVTVFIHVTFFLFTVTFFLSHVYISSIHRYESCP